MIPRGVKVVGTVVKGGAKILRRELPAAVTGVQLFQSGLYPQSDPVVTNPPFFSTSISPFSPLIVAPNTKITIGDLKFKAPQIEVQSFDHLEIDSGSTPSIPQAPSFLTSMILGPFNTAPLKPRTTQLMRQEIQQIQEPLTALVAKIDSARDINQLLNDFLH